MAELETKFRAMGRHYENVVVAAREARRINAMRIHGADGEEKVTNVAMQKMLDGDIEWEIIEKGEMKPVSSDEAAAPKEKEDPPIED